MPEVETAAPADDLKSVLAAAFAQHEAPTEAPVEKPKPEPVAQAAEQVTEEAGTKEPARSADGKFAKAEEAASEGEQPAEEKPEGEETPEQKVSAEHEKTLSAWKQADRDMFKKQSPEAQDFLMRRHKEMTADYEKKTQAIARLKTEYDPVDKMFEPYRDLMKQKGFTPAKLIESWANVEKDLAGGEDSAAKIIAGLITGYKVPLPKLSAALGIRPQQQTQTQPAPKAGITGEQQPQAQVNLPPEVVQALQQIPHLQQTVSGLTAAQQAAQRAATEAAADRAQREIDSFKSAVDDKGTLLHPHYDELEQDMLDLVHGALAAKKAVPSLSDLYEKAAWSNPSVREKLRTAEKQAAERAKTEQDKAKAAAAKKAAASVTGAPGSGQASAVRAHVERSLREELEEAAASQAA